MTQETPQGAPNDEVDESDESDDGARRPVVVVTGPTGGGKSALAIELCRRFGGEVVNADSMQVYRYMDIGTAKPSLEERAAAPHHVFDIVTPDQRFSAGQYVEQARRAAAAIHERGKVVFLTGGTGLYIRAFLSGLIAAGEADPELREALEREHAEGVAEGDPGRLHRKLELLDPEAARSIHPNDARRLVRAIEIREQAGESASRLRAEHGFGDRPYRALHLAIDPGREALEKRIEQRCQAMIDAGLLQEVRGLREMGYGPELRSMKAIGYRHITPVVDGSDTLANAVVEMRRDTCRFARRQRTWLRGVPGVEWFDPARRDAIYQRVESFLERAAFEAAASR